MNRVIVALTGIILLAGGGAAHGQWEPFEPALKKLMPKDQVEFVEKTEALAELHKTQLTRIKDAKKRGEENEQLAAKMKDLHESLVKKLQNDGLKNWVLRCDTQIPKLLIGCGGFQPFHMNFRSPLKNKTKSPEDEAVLALKPNEVFRFSTKADSSYAMPKYSRNSWGPFEQDVKLGTITKVEKLGVWSRQDKKVVAEANK
jgi:hypothetical protein